MINTFISIQFHDINRKVEITKATRKILATKINNELANQITIKDKHVK